MLNTNLTQTTSEVNNLSGASEPEKVVVNLKHFGETDLDGINRLFDQGYSVCVVKDDQEIAEMCFCQQCRAQLVYVGRYNRKRTRSFAVCPVCQKGFEF